MKTIWIERERYSGHTAEILDRAIEECGSDLTCPGIRILISAMVWLTIPVDLRSESEDQTVPPLAATTGRHRSAVPQEFSE